MERIERHPGAARSLRRRRLREFWGALVAVVRRTVAPIDERHAIHAGRGEVARQRGHKGRLGNVEIAVDVHGLRAGDDGGDGVGDFPQPALTIPRPAVHHHHSPLALRLPQVKGADGPSGLDHQITRPLILIPSSPDSATRTAGCRAYGRRTISRPSPSERDPRFRLLLSKAYSGTERQNFPAPGAVYGLGSESP